MKNVGVYALLTVVCSALTAQSSSNELGDRLNTTATTTCADSFKPPTNLDDSLPWDAEHPTALFSLVQKSAPNCSALAKHGTYIFHVTRWHGLGAKSSAPYALLSSGWYIYREDLHSKALVRTSPDQLDTPTLYASKPLVFVALQVSDDRSANAVTVTYKSSITPGKAANVQDLSSLVNALLGITAPSAAKEGTESCSVKAAVLCEDASVRLPYDLNIAGTAGVPDDKGKIKEASGSQSSSQTIGNVDCPALSAGDACAFKRTFTNLDREWWDVSVGVTTPGVKESQFSVTNSALQTRATTHTDLYALFDLYPFSAAYRKNSKAPHFNLGLPVTGKTFYRPYFGMAENLTDWTGLEKHGFPVSLNLFVGVVYMKTSQVLGAPTTASALQTDMRSERVGKLLVGVEVPVSSIVSKLGKGSSKSSASTASKAGAAAN